VKMSVPLYLPGPLIPIEEGTTHPVTQCHKAPPTQSHSVTSQEGTTHPVTQCHMSQEGTTHPVTQCHIPQDLNSQSIAMVTAMFCNVMP
jgi:hypothetical protein